MPRLSPLAAAALRSSRSAPPAHRRARPQAEIVFHNTTYILSLAVVDGEVLRLEVEQKSDASCWRGEFTAKCASRARRLTPLPIPHRS